MKSIAEMAVVSLEEIEANGFVQSEVTKNVTSAVKDAVAVQFNYSSKFRKDIQELINRELVFDISKISLVEYSAQVGVIIQNALNDFIITEGVECIKNRITSILTNEIPKTVKLSDVIKEFIEDCDFDDGEYHEITFLPEEITEKSKYRWIYFDKESCKKKYSCDNKLLLNGQGQIAIFESGNKAITKALHIGRLSLFEEYMFKLYAANTVIEADIDRVETEVYGDD